MAGLTISEELFEAIMEEAIPRWVSRAACRGEDPAMFFPEYGMSRYAYRALAICAECPVKAECLDHALTHDEEYGIWGGTSQRERRRIKRRAA